MLKLGTQNISALYVGGAKIKRALIGTAVVYEAVRPPAIYTVSAAVAPASGGSVTGAGQYQEGETVTLTYTPAEDHRFTGWYAGSTLLSQANPYTFAAAQDIAVTAKCEEIPTYTLTLAPTGISAQKWSFVITVNGSGTAWSGSGVSDLSPLPESVNVKEGSVTVQATSPDGYEFAGWQIGSGSVITSNPYTFAVTGDTTLYCRYAKKSRLPEGYTEVEYISPPDSTYNYGGVPLHANNVNFGTNTTIKVVFMPNGTAYSRVWSSVNVYNILSMSSATKVTLSALSNTSYASNSAVSLLNQKVTFTAMYSSQFFGIEAGTYANAFDLKRGTYTGNTIIYLGNTSATGKCCTGRYYSAEISNGSTKIANCVPCVAANGDVGMFNLVSNTFHKAINYSTYKWTAGPAV